MPYLPIAPRREYLMKFKFFALPLIGLTSLALLACGNQGPAGPTGPPGREGPVGPRGPEGAPGKDALAPTGKDEGAPGKSTSALLRRPSTETNGKTSTAACKADETIVSAICIGRGGRSTSSQVDVEKKSARCVRSTLYMVCGKTAAFGGE